MRLSLVKICLLGLAVWLSAVLASCGTQKKDEAVVIRLGEVTRSIFYAPQYVALAEGMFAEQGLHIELATTFGGDKTMTALLSGAVDIALVGAETSVYVHQQGSGDPVINFAQLTQTDGTFLVSRRQVSNFEWNMLKGSSFLGQRKGGMPQMAGEFTLKRHGIDPQHDLNLIQNIDFANIPAAFASGTGDYVQLFEPQATVFELEGKGQIVASFGAEGGMLPYTVFMSKQSFIREHADTVQKFTNAVYKAQQWVDSHTSPEIARTIAPYFRDTPAEVVEKVVDRYKKQGSFATAPTIDEAEWNHLLDIMEEAGELQQRADHGALVNNVFAENAINGIDATN